MHLLVSLPILAGWRAGVFVGYPSNNPLFKFEK